MDSAAEATGMVTDPSPGPSVSERLVAASPRDPLLAACMVLTEDWPGASANPGPDADTCGRKKVGFQLEYSLRPCCSGACGVETRGGEARMAAMGAEAGRGDFCTRLRSWDTRGEALDHAFMSLYAFRARSPSANRGGVGALDLPGCDGRREAPEPARPGLRSP